MRIRPTNGTTQCALRVYNEAIHNGDGVNEMKATYSSEAPVIEINAIVRGEKIIAVQPHPINDDDFEAMTKDGWLPGIYTKDQLVAGGADAGVL